MIKLTLKLLCILVQKAASRNDGMASDVRGLHCGQEHPCGERSVVSGWCDFMHSFWVGNAQWEPNLLPEVPSGLAVWGFFFKLSQVVQHLAFLTSWAECSVSVALADSAKIVLTPAI